MAQSKSGVRWGRLTLAIPIVALFWILNSTLGLVITLLILWLLLYHLRRTRKRNAKAAKMSKQAIARFGATHAERLAAIARDFDNQHGTLTFAASFQSSQMESYHQGFTLHGNQAVSRSVDINQLYLIDFTFARPIATLSPRDAAYLRAALELNSLREGKDVRLNDQCASLIYENGRGAITSYRYKPSREDPGAAAAASQVFSGATLGVVAIRAQLDMFAHSAHAESEEAAIADRLRAGLAATARPAAPVAAAPAVKTLGEQIAELQRPREAGALTEEQFEAAKAKIL